MVVTDQQLRQELIHFGESVPPITQRNRDQLRARLELLQSIKSKRGATSSPSKSRLPASPSRVRAAAASPSPSRTRSAAATASPTRTNAASSPSRARAAPSPVRTLATSSPSRTRTSTAVTSGGSARTTRSKQTPHLIELSDSEAESTSTGVLTSRTTRAGQNEPHVQTRSIALRSRADSPTSSTSSLPGPGTMADDVEQSIARHRREIKQLLDSARDRNRITNSNTSQSSQQNSSSTTSTARTSSKSEHDETCSNVHVQQAKQISKENNLKPSYCKQHGKLVKNLLKFLFVCLLVAGGLIYYLQNGDVLFLRQEEISCSMKNATHCDDMKSIVSIVRKQLQIRTGEVNCHSRSQVDTFVHRTELEHHLDEQGLKFQLGNAERWIALLTYIIDTPVEDIALWNAVNQQTQHINDVVKLSTKQSIRPLACRIQQDMLTKTSKNLFLFTFGLTGLLTSVWFLVKYLKNLDENERIYNDYLQQTEDFIDESYAKYLANPVDQSSVIVNDIRDKLIPENDQKRLQHIWQRIINEIIEQDTRLHVQLQEINGKQFYVWKWIPSDESSARKTRSQTANDDDVASELGLTECLKLRHCFRSDNSADDEEIDEIVANIENRCANIKSIEHIGIHSIFVYLKFSSKETAAQGYHQLNNWKYQNRTITVKYIRSNRYYEHFPEAQDIQSC